MFMSPLLDSDVSTGLKEEINIPTSRLTTRATRYQSLPLQACTEAYT